MAMAEQGVQARCAAIYPALKSAQAHSIDEDDEDLPGAFHEIV